jgi:hypothetical protein
MAGWRNKVEQSMDSVVTEARVSLDARLFGQNVIVLALQIADNLLEAIDNFRDSS